ncbi:hypothetical protein HYV72_02585 [Candidatus Uhrbacteria bacterium]|nr:hypothetical protein [Candidatus Uhrbacteria bacterium]
MKMDWKAEMVPRVGPPRAAAIKTLLDLETPNRQFWLMELMHHELSRLANTPAEEAMGASTATASATEQTE